MPECGSQPFFSTSVGHFFCVARASRNCNSELRTLQRGLQRSVKLCPTAHVELVATHTVRKQHAPIQHERDPSRFLLESLWQFSSALLNLLCLRKIRLRALVHSRNQGPLLIRQLLLEHFSQL